MEASSATAGTGFLWFWMDDDGSWNLFSDEDQDTIEHARIQGDEGAMIQVPADNGNTYTYFVDMNEHLQHNLHAGTSRAISRASEFTVWFWRDDNGRSWNLFGREEADLLTNAQVQQQQQATLTIDQKLYFFDLERSQQINCITGHTRDICQGRTPPTPSNGATSTSIPQGNGDGIQEEVDTKPSPLARGQPPSSNTNSLAPCISDGNTKNFGKTDKREGNRLEEHHDTLKIMFLGNKKMGSSSIVERLINNGRTATASANVGVNNDHDPPKLNIHAWRPVPAIQFNVWDFVGGPNVCPAFRAIFFTPETLFVIAWDMGVSNRNLKSTRPGDAEAADAALEFDIYTNVQLWVDLIQERVPDAIILPIATVCADHKLHDNEAKRRCKVLREQLVAGQQSTIVFGDNDDPVLRVNSEFGSIGLAELREKLTAIGTDKSFFDHIGTPTSARYVQVREAVRTLKRRRSETVNVNQLYLCDDIEDQAETRLALSRLSNVGELLYYSVEPGVPKELSALVILDVPWFVGLAGFILRDNLVGLVSTTRRESDTRRELDIVESPLFGGAYNVICPLISNEDANMMWHKYLDTSSTTSAQATIVSILGFLKRLLLEFGVMVPISQNTGPLSSFCIPSLLEGGTHGDELAVFRHVHGSNIAGAQAMRFFGRAPRNLMQRIIVCLLQEVSVLPNVKSGGQQIVISLWSVMCWRSSFRVKFSAKPKESNDRTEAVEVEVSSELVDFESPNISDGALACLFTSARVFRHDGGPDMWQAGYRLVLDIIRSVANEHVHLRFATKSYCHHCITTRASSDAYAWSSNEVHDALGNGVTQLTCQQGHTVSMRLLTGGGGEVDATSSVLESSLTGAVVLVGLYDARRKKGMIRRLGSGYIHDSERGLIVTAGRNVMRIEGEEHFGQDYDTIVGAKVVIGIVPANNGDDHPVAVFRYFAEICAKDPTMSDASFPFCRVDACLLKITSRFEQDTSCSNEIEPLLRDDLGQIRVHNLPQLPFTTTSHLEERVCILGFDQTENASGVNRRLSRAEGIICKRDTEGNAPERYQFVPRNTIVVMDRARPGHNGGPCVNQQGEVIGILSCADPTKPETRSCVVPVSEWQGLLDQL